MALHLTMGLVQDLYGVRLSDGGMQSKQRLTDPVLPVQHLSFMYVAVMCLAAVLLHRVMTTIPSVLFATYFAWAYLRFLQPHSGTLGR